MPLSGKYRNKTIDMISASSHPDFTVEKFINSIESHFTTKGASVDYFTIDMRNLDDAGRKQVKEYITSLPESKQSKLIITE